MLALVLLAGCISQGNTTDNANTTTDNANTTNNAEIQVQKITTIQTQEMPISASELEQIENDFAILEPSFESDLDEFENFGEWQ